MINDPVYTDDEWGLLVGLPQAVVIAASTVEYDGERRTLAEHQAGLRAIAAGRDSGTPLVAAIAREIVARVGDPDQGAAAPLIEFDDPLAGIRDVLHRADAATRLLAAKATAGDTAAYGHWLVGIADEVVGAARSGGVLGIGGDLISEPERRLRDRLAAIVGD